MRFAQCAADKVAFICDGIIVEEGPADVIFSNPYERMAEENSTSV
jgi:ABC-type phosphate transport system ATPase subunit